MFVKKMQNVSKKCVSGKSLASIWKLDFPYVCDIEPTTLYKCMPDHTNAHYRKRSVYYTCIYVFIIYKFTHKFTQVVLPCHLCLSVGFRLDRVPPALDALVIGSGIGGLTAAALLSKAGKRVVVLEQHDQAGGCTHTFQNKGFEFDVGKKAKNANKHTPVHIKILNCRCVSFYLLV